MEISTKNRSATFLLSLFLGTFGVHRFYAGRGASGVWMILMAISFVLLPISFIWGLIDTMVIASGSFKDGEGKIIKKW